MSGMRLRVVDLKRDAQAPQCGSTLNKLEEIQHAFVEADYSVTYDQQWTELLAFRTLE